MANPFFVRVIAMTISTHSFILPQFDPLALYPHFCPDEPGFIESINPRPETGRYSWINQTVSQQIIDELEPVGRSGYTGSAGYISACGNMDISILIRTYQRIGNKLTYQIGAGIIADSIPEKEWQECLHKGEALRTLLQKVES